MLRIKKYNDGIRVYGYYNGDDHILITKNDFEIKTVTNYSRDTDEQMSVGTLVGEIYDHFNVKTFQELSNKCLYVVTFVLGSQTKIENFDEVLKKLNDGSEVFIELDIDSELDTKEHTISLFNSLKNAVNFEIFYKVFEHKSNKGYVKSRELFIFSQYPN